MCDKLKDIITFMVYMHGSAYMNALGNRTIGNKVNKQTLYKADAYCSSEDGLMRKVQIVLECSYINTHVFPQLSTTI